LFSKATFGLVITPFDVVEKVGVIGMKDRASILEAYAINDMAFLSTFCESLTFKHLARRCSNPSQRLNLFHSASRTPGAA
jgi:hypothetical protein